MNFIEAFAELPEPVRTLAIHNHVELGPMWNHSDLLSYENPGIIEYLKYGFPWWETPQGMEYWYDVSVALVTGNEIPLPEKN